VQSVNGRTGAVTVNEVPDASGASVGQVLSKTENGLGWTTPSGGGSANAVLYTPQTLTAAQQECLKIAAKECQAYNKDLSEKVEEDTLKELGDKITAVEVDKSEWIAKAQDVINEATKDYADLYQKIQDLK
jgi:hypothetical protein